MYTAVLQHNTYQGLRKTTTKIREGFYTIKQTSKKVKSEWPGSHPGPAMYELYFHKLLCHLEHVFNCTLTYRAAVRVCVNKSAQKVLTHEDPPWKVICVVLGTELCPHSQNSYAEALPPSTSEGDFIWRQGLYRDNEGGMRSYGSYPGGSDGKESACNVGDPGSIPGSRISPGEGNGNPLHYSCLKNPCTEESGKLQSVGSQRVGHDE